ncbi:MAG: tetratricopeptide repeat protein, partial [Chloroflexi bacterium]|nr:tetratricopeptide repeat protein [Chloroflexota bacterium]
GAAYYNDLGDPRRAIEYYEQDLKIAHEIGDVMRAATTSFNLAVALANQGQRSEALHRAEYAAQIFAQIGHAQYAQQAQQLIAQIRGKKE